VCGGGGGDMVMVVVGGGKRGRFIIMCISHPEDGGKLRGGEAVGILLSLLILLLFGLVCPEKKMTLWNTTASP
jgi:phosphatidylserine decarboxylase